MSEENMNNNQAEEQNSQEEKNQVQAENISEKSAQNKPKSKKGIIIAGIIIILIIIAVAVYFLLTQQASKIAKELETSLNTTLEELKTDATTGIQLDYAPFKCKGSTMVTCKSDFIKITDNEIELTTEDNEFTIKPGIKNAELSFGSNIATTIKTGNGETLYQKIKCIDEAELDKENLYIINKIKCNNELEKVKSDFEGTIYAKHNEFAESTFVSLIEKFQKDKTLLDNTLENVEYALKDGSYTLSSDNLSQDIIDIVNKVGISEPMTLEEVKQEFESTKMFFEMMASGDNSEETQFVKESIDAVDNILNNNHNFIKGTMELKDDKKIDDVFFIGFDPKLYKIKVSSK